MKPNAPTIVPRCFVTAISFILACSLAWFQPDADARTTKKHTGHSSHRSRHHSSAGASRHHATRHHATRHHSRHHSRRAAHHPAKHHKAAAKPRYAYPLEIFMMHPPAFDQTPYSEETARQIKHDFEKGVADHHHPNNLVKAGVATYYPLRGGIFHRREPVKYIVIHSTETGPPVSAKSVIDAWSSLGRRHAGAQYVVERDGRIYQACEPDMATVHVNIFKTLPGINNDNSIGIEMNHTGKQNYPREQREAVIRLTAYLQSRFKVAHENIITHRYAQQGDHTDPVNFDFDEFLAHTKTFQNSALAYKRERQPQQTAQQNTESSVTTAIRAAEDLVEINAPEPTVYMEMHRSLKETTASQPPAPSTPASRDTALVPKSPESAPPLRDQIELTPDGVLFEQDYLPVAAPNHRLGTAETAPKAAPSHK